MARSLTRAGGDGRDLDIFVLMTVGLAELADIAGLAPGIVLAAAVADRRQAGPGVPPCAGWCG
jgi:membrane glycosyltransferase